MAIQQLLTFEGGLSTKIAPHLIGRNEGIVCENVDLEKGTLSPLKKPSIEGTTTGKYTEYNNGSFISNTDITDERFYVKYANRLYWSNANYGTYGIMKYDGTNEGVDAVAPSAPTVIAGVALNHGPSTAMEGIYSYTYTYVDTDGIESAPAPYAEIKVSGSSGAVDITFTDTPSVDIASRYIYRTGGNNPTYNLIAEVPKATTSYLDNTRDIDVSRIELTTLDNFPPNTELDMLIENLGTFWGSVGKQVFFSRAGGPEYWNPLDYIMLDKECTGLGVFANSIIAFTESSVYRIDGYSRDTVSVSKLPYSQGCVDKDTITNIDTYLVWTSKNGICLFDGASVQVITKQSIAWDEFARVADTTYDDYTTEQWNSGLGFEITFSRGYRDKYFGIFTGGIIVLDVAMGLKVSTIDLVGMKSLFYNDIDNVLYATDGAIVYACGGSNDKMDATWKTGRISDEGANISKHYRSVELDGIPLSVEVFIDGISRKIYTNKDRFKLPAGSIGKDIQFEITTNNDIRGIKYEYSNLKA